MSANFDASGVNPFLAAVKEAAAVGLLRVGEAVGRKMQQTLSGPGPSAPGAPPGVGDGTLRRSIKSVPVAPLHVRVGSSVFYGLVQETGNWGRPIVPVEKKFLLIPLTREARRMYRAANFNGRAMNLRLVPRPNKPTLLVKEQGKSHGARWAWRPLFILKRSVKLPPRPWAMPALVAARPQLPGVFARGATAALRGRLAGAR